MLESIVAHLSSKDGDSLLCKAYEEDNKRLLSDMRCKLIKSMLSSGKPLQKEQVTLVISDTGHPDGFDDNTEWTEDVAKKYADHLKNYLYTYKEEATDIDPEINPNEKHIGIMAQDLEHVNPTCVKELEDGTKVVDTNRLALMNAGVIADLARRLKALEDSNARS